MASRNKLTAVSARAARAGRHSDGAGLILAKQDTGAAQWLYRYQLDGRRREMGLGPFPTISLARAREMRDEWAAVKAEGRDPIDVREARRRAARAGALSLEEAATAALEARQAELRDAGKAGRWLSPVQLHVLPKLGRRPVDQLDAAELAEVLRPIWRKHPETARKALSRVAVVMRWAAATVPGVDLSMRERVRAILGDPGHLGGHIPSMPWREVPAFYAGLGETPTQLALRLLILTAARSRPVRYARPEHFAGAVWTIPGDGDGARMKGLRGRTADFRVPLSTEAQKVVRLAARQARDGHLFPSARRGTKGEVISDRSMAAILEDRGQSARPHGFRASFRDWCAESDVPEHLAEMALGHVAGSRVVRAYRRTDLLEQRAELVERWGRFVTGETAAGVGEAVVRLDPAAEPAQRGRQGRGG